MLFLLFAVWDLSRKNPTERDIRGRQMCPPLHQPPKWESRLHLPQDSFPNKDNSYTVSGSRKLKNKQTNKNNKDNRKFKKLVNSM